MAKKGMRTILVAYKDYSVEDYELVKDDEEKLETNLIALNIYGIADPVKASVPETVERCRNAGI